MTGILLAVSCVAVVLALKNKIAMMTVLYFFMEKRHCAPPTDAEMKECSEHVVKRLLHLVK